MRVRLLFLASLLVCAQHVFAIFGGYYSGYSTILVQSSGTLASGSDITFFNDTACSGCSYQMVGDQRIRSTIPSADVVLKSWGVGGLHYRNTLVGPPPDPGRCYFGRNEHLHAYITSYTALPGGFSSLPLPYDMGVGGPYDSRVLCLPSSPDDPTTSPYCYTDPETGLRTCSGGGGGVTPNYRDCGYFYGDWTGCNSPIVINPEDGTYPMSGTDDPVSFDLDANNATESCTWTAAGSPVAFLALDRNGNGSIDSGAELFGNHTPVPGGAIAPNGFEALAAYDTNGDGKIDVADPVWNALVLWCDKNHDGRSTPEELTPIAQSNVTAIALDYRTAGRKDEHGNYFRYQGTARLRNGARAVYDVFFRIRE